MSKRFYKDLDKYKAAMKRQKARYRKKYQKFAKRHKWTTQETYLIFTSPLPDSVLCKRINHAPNAIQTRRSKIRKILNLDLTKKDIINRTEKFKQFIKTFWGFDLTEEDVVNRTEKFKRFYRAFFNKNI